MSPTDYRPGQRLVVHTEYRSEFPDPIIVSRGDPLQIGDKKTHYTGWLWVKDADGRTGWLPEEFISRSGATGTALRDCDATELDIFPEDRLIVIETIGGWVRVRTEDGRIGWVPEENVSLDD
ncbi:MAG TPA: SH3 domain-containing protein [candidate division Zixibacteria bacterium]|nr:SH3 domain-containing protein [candidate division Zixibacteria bacterium]